MKSRVIAFLLIFACVFICYGRSLQFDFVYDDRGEMLERPLIHSLGNIPQFFTTTTFGYYRPLRTLVWAVDYSLYGTQPWGYHLTNLFAYAFCCWAVYLFAALLLRNKYSGLLAALLFLVHPLHVESVAWISGRGDLLAGGFLFLALFYAFKWTSGDSKDIVSDDPVHDRSEPYPRKTHLVAALVFCLLSMLCKEFGVVFPFLILLAAYSTQRFCAISVRRTMVMFGSSFLLVLVVMAWRTALLGSIAPGGGFVSMTLLERMVFSCRAFWRYIGLMLLPLHLNVDHAVNTQPGIFSPLTVASILGHAVLLLAFIKPFGRARAQSFSASVGSILPTFPCPILFL